MSLSLIDDTSIGDSLFSGAEKINAAITAVNGTVNGNLTARAVTPSGTLPGTAFGYNPLAAVFSSASDNAADVTGNGTNIPSLVLIQQLYGGSNINDGRNGLSVFTDLIAPTSPTNAYRFYVGMSAYSKAQVADNGTGGSPQGIVEAVTGSSQLNSGATNFFALIGGEFTVSADAGSSVAKKAIINLDNWPTDAVQGSVIDAHIWSTAHAGGIGSRVWAQIDADAGLFPLSSNGTVIKLISAGTIATGFDFGALTVTGNILQWSGGGYFIAGSGAAHLGQSQFVNSLGGVALTATGGANQYTAQIQGSLTAGQSFGLKVDAGTNASDFAMVIQGAVGSPNFLLMDGTGKSTFGAAIGVNGAAPPAQVTGWGVPAGPAVVAAFPATPTLAQCGAAIGKIIADLKALGVYAA